MSAGTERVRCGLLRLDRLARLGLGLIASIGGLLLIGGACTPTTAAGEVGPLRYAGRVKGEPPLDLLPPVTDPSGNVYVLNGAPTLPETHVFVGFSGGGWGATCSLTKGDVFGAHGWAGFASNRQWYWSGGALVAVSGTNGECHAVLDKDAATGADLFFQAVLPGVRNRSERTSLVALVQSPSDRTPFSAVVDLDAEFLTNVTAFEPANAEEVAVIGVGGNRERELGVVLVQYRHAGAAHLEARSYDGEGNLTDVTPVAGGPFAPYAVQGYLQMGADGLVGGLVAAGDPDGSMVLFTASDGHAEVSPIEGMKPVGVHVWDGGLWLVGVANDNPVIASIGPRGHLGAVTVWSASQATASALGPTTSVRDDRSLPSRTTTWSSVRTAAGAFPFLHAHALVKHAPDTTLWVFAGPSIAGSALTLTAFAMAPVGVSYP